VPQRRAWLMNLFLAAAVACAENKSRETVSVGKREIAVGSFRTVWRKEITEEDSIFAIPSKLATNGRVIAVLDPVANRVVGLERATGRVLWLYGKTGSGPGELRGPSDILAIPDRGFLVFDPANARIVEIDEHGRRVRESAVIGAATIRTACALDSGGLLAFELTVEQPIVHFDSSYRVTKRLPLPWTIDLPVTSRDAATAQGSDVSEIIRQSQGVFANVRGRHGCVFARQTADGLALIESDTVRWKRPYIDAPPVESLKVATSAAIAVMARGDTVYVPFHGTGPRRGRLIDLYHSSDGAYLGSLETPSAMSWVDADARGFVVLRSTGYGAAISLWELQP